ncbi:RluA family pseudouridine synthase [Archangium lansingense]|uniref:Pseudouridine synthase n=1 Tax=Archangium lansingense TaxID=2995310 RepID=A0ABT4A768_9BACT|nr:RluA family pseudouridine synthase [Archangium lansinium]MCY1077441.1 pseudouridine synthase [Archangium lansinium]
METWVTPFEPQPVPGDIAGAFPSPFDELGPHALARRAAAVLQAEFRAGFVAPGIPAAMLDGPEGGKMFGVLVVRTPDGRIGFLRSFSGMLAGRWEVPGFVPPLFDRETRERVEPAGEAVVKALLARAEAMRTSPELVDIRAAHEALEARHAAERAELRTRHEERKRLRHVRRAELEASGALTDAGKREALHALDQESRGDKAERRRMEAAQEEECRAIEPKRARLERRLRALERLRWIVCRVLMKRLHDTYEVPNARGERRPLRALYSRGEPPSGAADCAAPKLLAHAFTHGLQPLALAEFWWGAPPSAGGRAAGAFYAACKDKCAPLLPFMLEGLQVESPRAFSPPAVVAQELSVVFEDAWVVVVEKPSGLLSVPGKDTSVTDSVLARLRARYPHATGPLLVHRLDLDTSGLLIAALDSRTHAALQRQFIQREIHKRYVAWIEGVVQGEEGTIDFPMRVDLDDRPRQIHDPVHGKPAVTRWRVLERRGQRTRVAFFPLTGRTHQLRVHAAHPLGLGAPIVGDRLYGHEDVRLHLHAESLSFQHPETGQLVSFERPAPF